MVFYTVSAGMRHGNFFEITKYVCILFLDHSTGALRCKALKFFFITPKTYVNFDVTAIQTRIVKLILVKYSWYS